MTSSYISSSWRQHGWFVLELAQLPLEVSVHVLQLAALAARHDLAMSTRTAKAICLQVCKLLDPVILSAIGFLLGEGLVSAEVRPGRRGGPHELIAREGL